MTDKEVPVVTREVVCSQCNTRFQTDETAAACPSCGGGPLKLMKFVVCGSCDTSFWVDIDATRVMCPACEEKLPSGTDDWQDVYLEEVNKPIPGESRRNEKGDRTHSRTRMMKAKIAKFRRQFRYILYD